MVNRLLGIIYVLLNKGTVTAGELAERFEVSVRTIYRDVENLSMAGIPIYARKGKNGGISLTERFVLDRMLISAEEQRRILAALESLRETGAQEEGEILDKLGDFFKAEPVNWVSIDFSDWSGRRQELFVQIREAVLGRHVMEFDYYGQCGEMSSRQVEPVQLLFKEYTWYLRAYCRVRGAMRMFKVLRMKRVRVLEEDFEPDPGRMGLPEGSPGGADCEQTGAEKGGTGEPCGEQTGSEKSGTGEPCGEQAGSEKGGTGEPGGEQAGSEKGGTGEPGGEQAGAEKGGTGEPGGEQAGSEKSDSGEQDAGQAEQGIGEPGACGSAAFGGEEVCPEIVFRIDKREAYRIYDRFEEEEITILPSGDFEIRMQCRLDDWVYGLILSFGPSAEVLEPGYVREETAGRIRRMAENYSRRR